MAKAFAGLFAALVFTIMAAKIASNASISTDIEPVTEAWAQNRMEFVAWNGGRWTAWIHDGDFEHVPQDTGNWSRHSKKTIAFTDWAGEPWQAKVSGNVFLLAKQGDWQGAVEESAAIRYVDWRGIKRLRTVADLQR